jgi:hypothetical protein
MKNEQLKVVVLEPQRIKSIERAKQLLIPPVFSLRGIRAYDELRIVVTEVGQVKQTVTTLTCVAGVILQSLQYQAQVNFMYTPITLHEIRIRRKGGWEFVA